jgi:hypothetical protein
MPLFGGLLNKMRLTIFFLFVLGTISVSCTDENCECPNPDAVEYTYVFLYYKDHPDCVSREYYLDVHLSVDGEYFETWEFVFGSADPNSDYPVSIPFPVKKNGRLGVSFVYGSKSFQIRYDKFEIPLEATYATYISFFIGASDTCLGEEIFDRCVVYDVEERMECEGADSVYVAIYSR